MKTIMIAALASLALSACQSDSEYKAARGGYSGDVAINCTSVQKNEPVAWDAKSAKQKWCRAMSDPLDSSWFGANPGKSVKLRFDANGSVGYMPGDPGYDAAPVRWN